MGDGSKEREVARRFGVAHPASLLPPGIIDVSPQPSVTARLGLRSGSRVALVGVTDPAVASLRNGSSLQVSSMVPLEPVDAIVFQADSPFALRRVSAIVKLVKPRGVLWVLWPTNGRHLTSGHVESACKAAGMKCTWTTSVTGRLTGMKFIRRFADGR